MHTFQLLSGTSPDAASIVAGALTATGLDEFEYITAILELTGATGGILNVTLQTSDDGVTWYDWFRSADIAAGAATICIAVSAHNGSGAAPITIGKNLVPALAKATVRPGVWMSKMRAVFEAGAGMSAGAAQVIRLYGFKATG